MSPDVKPYGQPRLALLLTSLTSSPHNYRQQRSVTRPTQRTYSSRFKKTRDKPQVFPQSNTTLAPSLILDWPQGVGKDRKMVRSICNKEHDPEQPIQKHMELIIIRAKLAHTKTLFI